MPVTLIDTLTFLGLLKLIVLIQIVFALSSVKTKHQSNRSLVVGQFLALAKKLKCIYFFKL